MHSSFPSLQPVRHRGMALLLSLGVLGLGGTQAADKLPAADVQKVIEQMRLRGVQIQGEVRLTINGQTVILSENGVQAVESTPADAKDSAKNITPATLRWRNGETLTGTLSEVKDGTLLWLTSLFSQPLALDMAALKDVELSASTSQTEEPFRVQLRDGSRLFGTPVSLDADTLKLRSVNHGEVSLRLAEVVGVRRTHDAGLRYLGPDTTEGWRPTSSPGKADWRMQQGGSFGTQIWNRSTRLELELPEKMDVLLRVRSTAAQPEFTFTLGSGGASQQLAVENWSGTLVLTQGTRFVPLGDITGKTNFAVRLLWDRTKEHAMAFTPEGDLLGELKPLPPKPATTPAAATTTPTTASTTAGPSAPPVSKGVQLRNNGPDLTLDELRVREWSGEMPGKIKEGEAHAELTNGKMLAGKVAKIADDKLTLASGEEVRLDELDSIVTGLSAASPGTEPSAILAFGDGTRLVGNLQSLSAGKISTQITASATPVTAPASSLQHIHLAVPAASGAAPEPPFAKQDKLVLGKFTLHGQVLGAGSVQPRWLPVGGRTPVEVPTGSQPTFTRVFTPETVTPATALVYMENGDVLPAEVRAMDATSLHITSPLITMQEMPATQVQAVQFGGRRLQLSGFSDPGWRQVRGGKAALERDATKAVFRQAASLAHPNILQGDEVKFVMTAEDGWGALRVRVFTNGGDEPEGGIALLLYLSGNQLYAGPEADRGGDFANQVEIRVTPNQPVNIRLALQEKQVELFATFQHSGIRSLEFT